MTVDMLDMRDRAVDFVVTGMKDGAEIFQRLTLLDVGIVLLTVGTVLAINALWQDYRKKKGYRMVLRDRNDKAHALLGQIINDGLFEAECAGKISNQEVLALYREMSKKLDLPDLVPKKTRLKIVKAELKKLRNSKDPGIVAARAHKPNIPGGPPTAIVRQKFKEYVGSFASKLRRSA